MTFRLYPQRSFDPHMANTQLDCIVNGELEIGQDSVFDQLDIPASSVRETTLKSSVTFHGIGLHSGKPVEMTVLPAPAGTGIIFRRQDLLSNAPEVQARALAEISILAHPAAVTSTQLGSTLTNSHGVSISTVEHLMAAFAGCGIDNVIIEIDSAEVPIMDGSSLPFVEGIEATGIRHLNMNRQSIRITKKISVKEGDRWIYITPVASESDKLEIDVLVDYAASAIGQQHVAFTSSPDVFRNEVSAARTFCNLSDVEMMRAQGKALGGSVDNAIVVDDAVIVNEDGLRCAKEFAYHKALDLLGDLYLLGRPLIGKVSAFKPGHDLNTKLALAIAQSDAFELVETSETEDQGVMAHA